MKKEVENKRIIIKIIEKLKLNLRGLTVLTEAASGNFVFTPLIAALAGANKVFAFTKDSQYGRARDIAVSTLALAKKWGVGDKITIFQNKLPIRIIKEADIITNLGFLRPLNKDFITKMKLTAVIPLMYEPHEFRGLSELDIKAVWRRGIPVLGTNETSPLRIWDYWGALAVQKIREAGKAIKDSNIAVIADHLNKKPIIGHLKELGAVVWEVSLKTLKRLNSADILIIAIHDEPALVIGKNGLIKKSELEKLKSDILIIQLTGTGIIDRKMLDNYGLAYFPKNNPLPRSMSWTFGDLGPRPVIELHGAGLKVGEVMARGRKMGLDFQKTIEFALKYSPARDFSVQQKKEYEYPE